MSATITLPTPLFNRPQPWLAGAGFPGRAWLYALVGALALLQMSIASLVGHVPIFEFFSPRGLGRLLPVMALPTLMWLTVLTVKVLARGTKRPSALLSAIILRKRALIARGLILAVIMIAAARATMAWKAAIPSIVQFHADPWLIAADRALFGTDPWRLTHAVFGPAATALIDRAYFLWLVATMFLVTWLVFTRDRRFQLRGLLSYQLSWLLLGNFGATALASVGPCFYDEFYGGADFAPLMATLHADDAVHPLLALPTIDYLRASIGTDNLGAGISAMPSLHVAMAFLMALCAAYRFGTRWPSWLAGGFALIILVGSVHLGWHYAIDGLVSLVGVAAIWWSTDYLVERLDPRTTAN